MSARTLPRALFAAAALLSCSHNPPPRATMVEREQRVTADTPDRTRWFATLYLLQRVLATADARRLDAFGPLETMLCLPSDPDLTHVGSVLQARLTAGHIERVTTRLRRTYDSEQALSHWVETAATSNGVQAERAALAAIEATLVVERVTDAGAQPVTIPAVDAPFTEPRCEPGVTEGTQGADPTVVQAQLYQVLRRSAAQALMFQRAVTLAGDLQTQMRALSPGTTGALAAEFQAGARAVVGVAARATMDLHEATRTQQWAQALLTPEGAEDPTQVPDVDPSDNDPREHMPDPDAMNLDAAVLPDAARPTDVPVPINSYVGDGAVADAMARGDASVRTDAQVWSDVFVGHDNRPTRRRTP